MVVRPDQYVAHVLPLDAHDELAEFFEGFMLSQCRVAGSDMIIFDGSARS